MWPPPTEVLQDEQAAREAHLQELMVLADQKIRSVGAISTSAATRQDEQQIEETLVELSRVGQQLDNLASAVDRKRQRAVLLERENADRWKDVREAKHPACPFDGTPLNVEQARFVCPLPRLPDPSAAERIAAETNASLKAILDELERDQAELTTLRTNKAAFEARAASLRRRIDTHQLTVAEATKASQAAWATKGMVRRLFELATDVDDAIRVDKESRENLKSLQDSQVAGLASYSTGKLERWFDFLIRRIVSPEAKGTVTLDGHGLHPKIHWRGTRRSVALNSLQVVLFDLAAMLCSVEGDSRAPAFLVHDSPREGDLDPWTYARLFEALYELGADDSSAPFQYIVTTTTDPPDGVRSRVRLELSARDEQHRLFQVDL